MSIEPGFNQVFWEELVLVVLAGVVLFVLFSAWWRDRG